LTDRRHTEPRCRSLQYPTRGPIHLPKTRCTSYRQLVHPHLEHKSFLLGHAYKILSRNLGRPAQQILSARYFPATTLRRHRQEHEGKSSPGRSHGPTSHITDPFRKPSKRLIVRAGSWSCKGNMFTDIFGRKLPAASTLTARRSLEVRFGGVQELGKRPIIEVRSGPWPFHLCVRFHFLTCRAMAFHILVFSPLRSPSMCKRGSHPRSWPAA
jgi:hypothetical protein